LFDTFFEPSDVVFNAPRPTILETADFAIISLNDFIISVAEKRRIEINQIDRFAFQRLHDFQTVAQNEAIDWRMDFVLHGDILP
jgi:hypothetical protein